MGNQIAAEQTTRKVNPAWLSLNEKSSKTKRSRKTAGPNGRQLAVMG